MNGEALFRAIVVGLLVFIALNTVWIMEAVA